MPSVCGAAGEGVDASSAKRRRGLGSATRRSVLRAMSVVPVLGLAAPSQASPLAGLARWGSGEFRRFGFLIYTATLWAGDDPLPPPLALRLDYQRSIEGSAIAEASVREMRRFVDDAARLDAWGAQMRAVFPDVQPGDHLLGVYRPEGAYFHQGERLLGAIEAPGFAAAFFAIWLDERTSAPQLRAALLTRPKA